MANRYALERLAGLIEHYMETRSRPVAKQLRHHEARDDEEEIDADRPEQEAVVAVAQDDGAGREPAQDIDRFQAVGHMKPALTE